MKKLTAYRRNKIREKMVDISADFLPLSSHNKSAITFSKIFKQSNVSKYLKGDTKKQQLRAAWEFIIKMHPRLPTILFRKIIPAELATEVQKKSIEKKSNGSIHKVFR